jgi:hypothetical protein
MLKKLRPLLLLATLAGSKLFGQTGDIKVTLVDEKKHPGGFRNN